MSVVELASGIDALYLSGRLRADDGADPVLPGWLLDRLQAERDSANLARAAGVESSAFCTGGYEFTVGWGGWDNYRFRLDVPGKALIGLVPTMRNMPMVRVQPRAEFIHAEGIEAVLAWVYGAAEALELPVDWSVSRLDLFADFHGLEPSADRRREFVCRAKARQFREDGEDLETLYFGTGRPLLARVYDKTKESAAKGTNWWPEVWGAGYRAGEPVWRVEFEINRGLLRDFCIDTPEDVLRVQRLLWRHITANWLTLRTPSADSNRSRWPIAEAWKIVQAVPLGCEPIGVELVREGKRRGELDKLRPLLVGVASSVGALLGTESEADFWPAMEEFFDQDAAARGVPLRARLANKRREYGVA